MDGLDEISNEGADRLIGVFQALQAGVLSQSGRLKLVFATRDGHVQPRGFEVRIQLERMTGEQVAEYAESFRSGLPADRQFTFERNFQRLFAKEVMQDLLSLPLFLFYACHMAETRHDLGQSRTGFCSELVRVLLQRALADVADEDAAVLEALCAEALETVAYELVTKDQVSRAELQEIIGEVVMNQATAVGTLSPAESFGLTARIEQRLG